MVQCHAQAQNSQQQHHALAAAVVATSCLCVPAAHAATELLQPDVATAVGSGAAVAGLGALLVAADPQKRCGTTTDEPACAASTCLQQLAAWPVCCSRQPDTKHVPTDISKNHGNAVRIYVALPSVTGDS